jgi:hypothetical protein
VRNSIYALIVLAFLSIDSLAVMVHTPDAASGPLVRAVFAADSTDIQWFKDKMGIDPKYRQESSGIWGLPWTHVISMGLLVLFFIAFVISIYLRNRRTRELLALLLKEKEHGAEG